MFGLKRNQAVEPPPPQYASGPTQTGKTYQITLADPAAVNYFCSLVSGEPRSANGAEGYIQGCYRPDLDAVVLMDPKTWPSQDEWNQLQAHEWAHARGWRHNPDGTGTSAASLPPVGLIGSQYAQQAPSLTTTPVTTPAQQGAAIGNR